MPPFLARRLGDTPVIATSAGTSRGSATVIGPDQFLTCITGSNSGGGLLLPSVGADGCLLGDSFTINNQIAPLTLYGTTGTTFSGVGTNAAASGSGGISIASHATITVWAVTSTTWIGVAGVGF